MNSKKSMTLGVLIGILIGIIITLIGVFVYFIVTNDNTKDDTKTKPDSFVLDYLSKGNKLYFYNQNIVVTNIKELDLKQEEYINIYLTGKDIDKQELVLVNGVVAIDYENSDDSVPFMAPEDMYVTLNCIGILAQGEDYKIVVERVENKEGAAPELSNNIEQFLSDKCFQVEEDIDVEIGDDLVNSYE